MEMTNMLVILEQEATFDQLYIMKINLRVGWIEVQNGGARNNYKII